MEHDRHRTKLDALVAAVADGPGQLDAEVRRSLCEGKPITGALGAFAIKVAQNPTSITDEHIQALLRAGYSEDAIFECVIAAAMGAGMERLRAGMRALNDASR